MDWKREKKGCYFYRVFKRKIAFSSSQQFFCSASWSTTEKAWFLPNTQANRKFCQLHPEIAGKRILDKISPINRKEYLKFQTILNQNGYSPNTIRTYSSEFAHLLYDVQEMPIQSMTSKNLQRYFLYCAENLKLSEKQIHSRINAAKFYFEKVSESGNRNLDIFHPRTINTHYETLNSVEINKLIEITSNLKHKLILIFCYELGMRISELWELKIEDVDTKRNLVYVKKKLGSKTRKIPFSNSVWHHYQKYISQFHPKHFVFEGFNGSRFHKRSFQMVLKNAMQKAGIQKPIAIHGKQNSYSILLKEMGVKSNYLKIGK